jgi:hypothetical protein
LVRLSPEERYSAQVTTKGRRLALAGCEMCGEDQPHDGNSAVRGLHRRSARRQPGRGGARRGHATITVRQGDDMGRPSRITVTIAPGDDRIKVSGTAAPITG